MRVRQVREQRPRGRVERVVGARERRAGEDLSEAARGDGSSSARRGTSARARGRPCRRRSRRSRSTSPCPRRTTAAAGGSRVRDRVDELVRLDAVAGLEVRARRQHDHRLLQADCRRAASRAPRSRPARTHCVRRHRAARSRMSSSTPPAPRKRRADDDLPQVLDLARPARAPSPRPRRSTRRSVGRQLDPRRAALAGHRWDRRAARSQQN